MIWTETKHSNHKESAERGKMNFMQKLCRQEPLTLKYLRNGKKWIPRIGITYKPFIKKQSLTEN
jgi:hypothetical protein